MGKFRLFNSRPIVTILVSFCVGILVCNYFFTNINIAITIALIFLSVLIFYSVKLKQFSVFIVCFITMILGSGLLYARIYPFLQLKEITNSIIVSGEIIDFDEGKYSYVVIKNAKIDKIDIDGAVAVYYDGDDYIAEDILGKEVVFYINSIKKIDLFNNFEGTEDIVSSFYITNNIKYFANSSIMEIVGDDEELYMKIRSAIKDKLSLGLTNENTELMFSALFGEKRSLSEATYDYYKVSGVAHVLAVSGLHIGLIAGLLAFILKLFRVKSRLQPIFIIPFLIFYCYICAWTPSVVRATIMISVLLISKLAFREYDSLSAISFAGLIILLINPEALFDVSFLLSFGCVLGLSFFYSPFRKVLKKLHICNKLTESLIISTIVSFSIALVTLYYFGNINFMSILTNIIVLPIFSVIFNLTFLFVILSFILPFVSTIIGILNLPIDFINLFIVYVATISKIFTGIKISYLTIVLFTVLLVFCSKYFLKKGWVKLSYVSVITILLITQILVNNYVIPL